MSPKDVEDFCRSLPAATAEIQWQTDLLFKVGGKMFAVLGPAGTLSFKANEVAFEMLCETGAARPAPYLARAKWVFLDEVEAFDGEDLKSYLTEAHGIIADKLPRKARAELGL